MNDNKKLFVSRTSPDNKYTVLVYYQDAFGFGAHKILVYGKNTDNSSETLLQTDELFNDGANLKNSNISLEWIDNEHARLILSGQEQNATQFHISASPEWKCTIQE